MHRPSQQPRHLDAYLATYLAIYLPACPAIYQPAYMACHVYRLTYLPLQPSIYRPTCPPIHQPTSVAYLSTFLHAYLYVLPIDHSFTKAHKIWFLAQKGMIFSPRPAGARHLFFLLCKNKLTRLISSTSNLTRVFSARAFFEGDGCYVLGAR